MTLFSRLPVVCLVLACLFLAGASTGQAQSHAQLDKHARKIHHKLAKYPSGRYLHLMLANDTENYGALGALSETGFTFTNADTNTTATYAYSEVSKVKTDKEPIGEGTEPRRHFRHMMPVMISVAALGAAGAVYAAER